MVVLNKQDVSSYINKRFYVYGLINPITDTIFYIGKGTGERLFHHETEVIKGRIITNKHLFYTIKSIVNNGLLLKYTILIQTDNEPEAYLKEKEFIEVFPGLTNIHAGGKGRTVGSLENTYGVDKAAEIKRKVSKNHADVSGENNPRFKKLPDTIKMNIDNGRPLYSYDCANPQNNPKCRIKIISRDKSKAISQIGKGICVSCGNHGSKNAMHGRIGTLNPMAGKSVKDIWIEKYGLEIANKMWLNQSEIKSINRIGYKHTEEVKNKIGIGNSKPKSEKGRLNIKIAAQNRKNKLL